MVWLIMRPVCSPGGNYGNRAGARLAIKKAAFFDRLRILWIDRSK
jgi:hypothetical protein